MITIIAAIAANRAIGLNNKRKAANSSRQTRCRRCAHPMTSQHDATAMK